MADVLTPEQRRKCMSRIRSRNTRPEIIIRKFLFAHGFRFRINVKRLPGTPDIVLRKYKTVIFVNGCFWHGHEGCRYFRLPKSNVDFWKNKIERNKERDLQERIKLRDMGWHVIQFWECQLKHLFLENFAVYRTVPYGKAGKDLNLIAAETEVEYKKNKPLKNQNN